MSFRGTLTECLNRIGFMYKSNSCSMPYILANDTGHYYVLLTEAETPEYLNRPDSAQFRLVLRCSLSEMRKIQSPSNLSLF